MFDVRGISMCMQNLLGNLWLTYWLAKAYACAFQGVGRYLAHS
jgi:hypothetical protein